MIVNKELAKSDFELKDLWETPKKIFDKLNEEFRFTLDPCATPETAKCEKFYSETENGLFRNWTLEIVFCNPPYSRGNIDKWVKKCFLESEKGAIVVALLPVSTSSDWWHNWIVGKAELRWVKRRIRFEGGKFTAPFSSVIAVFGGEGNKTFEIPK